MRSSGKPMSATRTCPARSAPGRSAAPAFMAPNVTVRSAWIAAPSTAPVDPFTPEGMSTATMGTSASFRPVMASAHASSGMPRNPVPKMASIATSARASSRARAMSENGSTRTEGASSKRAAFVAAGSRRSESGSSVITATRTPQFARYRAATRPSPPLFPLPQTTTARLPYEPPMRSTHARATALPARSIRSSAGMPRAWASRSSIDAWSDVRTGFTRAPPPRTPPRSSSRG